MVAPNVEAEALRITVPQERLDPIVRHIVIGVLFHNPENAPACLRCASEHIVFKNDIAALPSPSSVRIVASREEVDASRHVPAGRCV